MTGREQDRRRRRADPVGGSPSRRTDRVRRTDRAGTGDPAAVDPDTGTEPDEYPWATRRSARTRRRPDRTAVVSRVLGQVLGRLTTRRAALLALIVCGLALSVAVPLHTYLAQRDELAAQHQQQQVLRAQLRQLREREQQLSDPAQVEAEARTRLHFVLPGETPYVVQLPATPATPGASRPGAKHSGPTTSWYQQLWSSIVGPTG